MSFLKDSFIFSFLMISFQAFSSEECRSSFLTDPLEKLKLSFETRESLQKKGVGSLSDLLLEEEKELTEPDQLKSLLRRLKEELTFRIHPSPITLQEIQKIFSDKGNYAKYRGQEGYLLFVKRTPNANSMNYIFNLVSKVLKDDFQELGWQQFHGSVEEFEELQGRILDEDGRLREEYQGMSGYALFARKYYGRDMSKTFRNVSAVLDKEVFRLLGWQFFHGLVEEFEELRGKILDEEGRLKEKYRGMPGYARFARDHYGRNMHKTFVNISAVLDKEVFKLLGWQFFHGLVEEFEELRGKILDEDGRLKEKYRGMPGQARFARDHYGRDMKKTFQNVSAVLNKEVFKLLGWQQFYGSVEEFEELRGKILDEDGRLKEKYRGMPGQARFARDHYGRDMQKTFQNVSAVLDKEVFKLLGWQSFRGSVEEFEELREKILDEDGRLKEKYRGMPGYARFARDHYGRDMNKTFLNVSAVLDKEVFKLLGWQQFHGFVEEFEELRGKILDEEGKLKEKYRDMPGYARFARDHYGRDMNKTFLNVSAVLDKEVFKLLGWQSFQGSVEEFEELRGKILDEEGRVREEYQGMSGYARFARDHYGRDMSKTFKNISAVLGGRINMKLLGLDEWKSFQGSSVEYYNLIQLFQEMEIEELQGLEGQRKVAEEIFEGNKRRAYRNVSLFREVLIGNKKPLKDTMKWLPTLK